MNDEPLFVKVDKPDRHKGSNGKWRPLIEALGSGDAFKVAMKQSSIATTIGRRAAVAYPGKRLASHREDATHTIVWLVDR